MTKEKSSSFHRNRSWYRLRRHTYTPIIFTFLVLAAITCYRQLRWGHDGQVAGDDGAAVHGDVVGEGAGLEGAAGGDEQDLLEVLAEDIASEDVCQGLSTT